MGRIVAKNIDELVQIWKKNLSFNIEDNDEDGRVIIGNDENGFKNVEIDFKLNLPFPNEVHIEMQNHLSSNISLLKFKNCLFLHDVYIGISSIDFEFTQDCFFKKTLKLNGGRNNIKFRDCTIEKLDCEGAVFGNEQKKDKGKLKLYSCDLYEVNFRNSTFHSLANFFKSTFYKPTTFYKTKFLNTVVFSAVTFKENVLFSYAVINELMMLRGTFPEKGFDISIAIIKGDLSIFSFKFDDYITYSNIYKDIDIVMEQYSGENAFIKAYEEVYEDAVSYKHLIPIENKRETYRILKHQLESQKNFIDAIPYKVMESKTHFKESARKLIHNDTFTRPLSNLFILSLNAISNWFGSSYVLGVLFTSLVGAVFFNASLSHIGNFEYTFEISQWQWQYYVQFLNPTHRIDYMKEVDPSPEKWFFIWDFIGRIFIGYGIYQTIQAFRKYK